MTKLPTIEVINPASEGETMTVNRDDIDEMVYSAERINVGLKRGRQFFNPMFYSGPIASVQKVFVVGHWPRIVADYEALNIPVVVLDSAQAAKPPKPEHIKDTALKAEAVRQAPPIPENYEDMSWPQLRSAAAKISDVPVVNKKQALEIMAEAEAGRAEDITPAAIAPGADAWH